MNEDAPKPKRKLTWLWVILGILFVLFIVGVGVVFMAVSFFRQNVTFADNIGESEANREFAAVLAKFPGQQPLIRLVNGEPQYFADRASQTSSTKPLTTMHVLAFDPDDGDMATFSLPFWLLRMKSGPIRLSAYSQGWDDNGVSFKIEDLEKAGPGIVIDVTRPREGRFLVWVE
jgi:hypothetical protein